MQQSVVYPGGAVATLEAVQRRRDSRESRTLTRREKEARREERERKIAHRMVGRIYGGQVIHLILLDYRFWLARRCGWNALSPDVRDTGKKGPDGRPVLSHPYSSSFWRWWRDLHYTQRKAFADMSPHTLRRGASVSLPSKTYLIVQRELAAA